MRIKPFARVIAKFPAENKKEKGYHFSIFFSLQLIDSLFLIVGRF